MSILSDAPQQRTKSAVRSSHQRSESTSLSASAWIIILVLLSLLVATDFVAYLGWTLADGVEVSTAGYIAMAMGVLFSLIVGCGLMALVFINSRRRLRRTGDFDQAGHQRQASGD